MHDQSIASRGTVTAVLGPTNTGKTHLAVERMLGHSSGMIGLPLRLLAREVYDRVVIIKGPQAVALITGEEKIVPPRPSYYVCTVEAMPLDLATAFLAVDEIQLAGDPERGHVFTNRLLNARGTQETMFMGSETMRPLLAKLIPHANFITRPRFSNLSYTGPKKLSRLPRRSAVVAFSADAVYSIAELIRRQRGGAAVVMGALSPRTRNAQVALYQSGEVDFMVATDAIGMGLNMDVDHVAFASLTKFDGQNIRALRASEAAQIAGRAGRYMNDGTFGTTADAAAMDGDLVEQIENHRFDPLRALQWRNAKLDYSSLRNLIASLDAPPKLPGLVRVRPAIDVQALKSLAANDKIARLANAPAANRLLWDVCQIPDFRKVMTEFHIQLLMQIYTDIMGNRGAIDQDWMARHVDKLDRSDGDLDTLATRIAHTRTWTFIANRSGWVDDPAYWQERTRAIENKLSDALHERLTQRFIDRRTSVLMKRLRDNDSLLAAVTKEGEVSVEGEYVGSLQGFVFAADPRAHGVHSKALRTAAMKALEPEIESRISELSSSSDESIELNERGQVRWNGSAVAHLEPGPRWITPKLALLHSETLEADQRKQIIERLERWLNTHIEARLDALVQLHKTVEDRRQSQLTGLARGIGFQLVEKFGLLNREDVADDITNLEQPDRAQLRRLGVRFGEFSIFMPKILKPAAAQLLLLLWKISANSQDAALPAPPNPGLCSAPREAKIPYAFYAACGFRPCGNRAVRVDMLERLAQMIREETRWPEHKKERKKGKGKDNKKSGKSTTSPDSIKAAKPVVEIRDLSPLDIVEEPPVLAPTTGLENPHPTPPDQAPQPRIGEFVLSSDMLSLVGCSGDDFESILRTLGFRKRTFNKTEDLSFTFWSRTPPKSKQGKHHRTARKPDGKQQDQGKQGAPHRKPHQGKKTRHSNKTAAAGQNRPKEKKMDPDSPFAQLKVLTERKP